MFQKNLLKLLLLTFVLGQYCLAKPTNNEIVVTPQTTPVTTDLCHYHSKYKAMLESTVKDSETNPSVLLLKLPLSSLMDLSISYAEKAKLISEKLLKDQEIVSLDDNVEEVKDFKQNLRKFEEGYKSCEDIQELFDIVELYSNTTSAFYEQESAEKLSANGKVILKILKKYETEKLEDEYIAELDKFVSKFVKSYENLKEAIKKENKDLEEKISEWHKEFKTLTTYEEKIAAFEKFTELYDIE